MIPQWINNEMAHRLEEAKKAYESIKHLSIVMEEQEYIDRYLSQYPPLTWVSDRS